MVFSNKRISCCKWYLFCAILYDSGLELQLQLPFYKCDAQVIIMWFTRAPFALHGVCIVIHCILSFMIVTSLDINLEFNNCCYIWTSLILHKENRIKKQRLKDLTGIVATQNICAQNIQQCHYFMCQMITNIISRIDLWGEVSNQFKTIYPACRLRWVPQAQRGCEKWKQWQLSTDVIWEMFQLKGLS